MALSPAPLVRYTGDGDFIPIAAGTTFSAGDVVVVGTYLVGLAAYDYDALGSTGAPNSVRVRGRGTFAKAAAATFSAGDKVYWNSTAGTVSAASTASTQYILGVAIAAGTTAQTTADVLFFPGA